MRKTLLEAGLGCPTVNVLETAHADCRRLYDTIIARHKAQNQKADAAYAEGMARTEARRQRETEQAEAKYPKRLAELTAWRERALQTIEERDLPGCRRSSRSLPRSKQFRVRFGKDTEEGRSGSSATGTRWPGGGKAASSGSGRRPTRPSGRPAVFPDWNTDDRGRWTPPAAIPPAVPFAFGTVKLADIRGGLPADERLRPCADRVYPAAGPALSAPLAAAAEGEPARAGPGRSI